MYEFAVVLFMGLVICKLVDVAAHFEFPKWMRAVVAFVLGLVGAYAMNLDLFAMWKVGVRDGFGMLGTGLVFGAMASVWHEVLGLVQGIERKTMDEALELENKAGPRAA